MRRLAAEKCLANRRAESTTRLTSFVIMWCAGGVGMLRCVVLARKQLACSATHSSAVCSGGHPSSFHTAETSSASSSRRSDPSLMRALLAAGLKLIGGAQTHDRRVRAIGASLARNSRLLSAVAPPLLRA